MTPRAGRRRAALLSIPALALAATLVPTQGVSAQNVAPNAVQRWNDVAGRAALASCLSPGNDPLHESRMYALAALAARTSAEVTVVFDGAAVAVPAGPTRGVRVLFSPPGVIADDVIRDLAAAEPTGRVVVVVSSDRDVADRVRRLGARTAGSPVLQRVAPLIGLAAAVLVVLALLRRRRRRRS